MLFVSCVCVCVCRGCRLLSVCVCVRDLLIFLHQVGYFGWDRMVWVNTLPCDHVHLPIRHFPSTLCSLYSHQVGSVVTCLCGAFVLGFWGGVLVVCVRVSGVLFSVGVCVCV